MTQRASLIGASQSAALVQKSSTHLASASRYVQPLRLLHSPLAVISAHDFWQPQSSVITHDDTELQFSAVVNWSHAGTHWAGLRQLAHWHFVSVLQLVASL